MREFRYSLSHFPLNKNNLQIGNYSIFRDHGKRNKEGVEVEILIQQCLMTWIVHIDIVLCQDSDGKSIYQLYIYKYSSLYIWFILTINSDSTENKM